MTRKNISKGVNLNIIKSDKFKTNYMSVCFVLPIEKENIHLTSLLPKVLARGCKKYPDMAKISERLEYLYASGINPVFIKRAQTVVVGFSADFIRDSFVPGDKGLLEDVSDLLFGLIFDALAEDGAFKSEYVESEKIDLINIINAKINNKAAYAKDKCTEAMFEGHPYGLSEYGKAEDVKNITPEALYKRYEEIINGAPLEIFFNGECDEDALCGIIKKYVPETDRNTEFPGREFLIGKPERVTELEEEMPVAQGKLVMGLRIGGININTEDSAAFSVFNELFGGSPSSKLFMNVREAMSLCYYCRSMPDQYMSTMFISSGIETENKEKAKTAILEQLDAVKNGDFTEEDIEDAKRSMKNSYKELDDSQSALCAWFLSRLLMGSTGNPDEVVEKILNVTKDEIVKAANKVELDTVYFIKGTGNEEGDEE